MIAPSSYGALSATSANTIQGHKPGFAGQSGAKKLGFKVGGISYSEANPVLGGANTDKDKIVPGTPREFEKTLKLNEFSVQGLTASDFTVANDYYDADGDGAATPAFTVGGVSYKWFDRNGTEITDENKMVGCSGLSLPLTLKINLAAQSHSKYGAPRDSDPAGLEQRYQITAPSDICFAKPNQMIVKPEHTWVDVRNGTYEWNNGNWSYDFNNGGGYDPIQFDPINGFKASANPKFPTTGFPKAKFRLIMTGNSMDWTFISNNSAVTVDTNGDVTLNSKPSGAVTIKAIFKNDTSQVHNYTFNPTILWVEPKSSYGNYAKAINLCGGVSNLLTKRDGLTNSPRRTAPQSWDAPQYHKNACKRAIGTLFCEWGETDNDTYPGSQWLGFWFWVSDKNQTYERFVINVYGDVAFSTETVDLHHAVVCRG
ncbi:hypothetical protein RCS94_08960 [Orbaceae bacterium ac157xtp]